MDNLAGERGPDGCANGWLDKVSSGHFTPTAPHFPLLRKTLRLQVSEASQLWSGTDDQAHQGESRGAGQIQGGRSREGGLGEAREMEPENSGTHGVLPFESCPLPRAGWAPVWETTSQSSRHPGQAMAAEGEGRSRGGGRAGSGRLGKEADIRTGSPIVLAEPSGAQGHLAPAQAQLMGSALPSFTAWGTFL